MYVKRKTHVGFFFYKKVDQEFKNSKEVTAKSQLAKKQFVSVICKIFNN